MWRSRILFALVFAGALLLVRYPDENDIGFVLVYALLLLVVVSLVTVLTAPLFLRIDERTGGRELFKNDELRFEATLANRGLCFYPRIRLHFYSAGLVDYGEAPPGIAPRGKARIDRRMRFPYRGVYELGVRSMTVTDFLGLFRVTFSVTSPMTVTVYPEGDEDFSIYIPGDSQDASFRQNPGSESYADVADVRKYASSDSFRKIHWNLSAKRGELMVKNFHSFDPSPTVLFLDTLALPLTGMRRAAFEDKMVAYAAAAINYCMESRLPARFVYGDSPADQEDIDPAEHPDRLYRLLAGVQFDRRFSPLPAFCGGRAAEVAGCNLVLFLSAIDEVVLDTLIHMVSYDRSLVVYYFHTGDPGAENRRTLDNLRACGITINRVEVPLEDIPA